MFIDDEKPARNYRRREGRAVFYITVTALAACVLMLFGLMNVAQANLIDDDGLVIQGEIGDTHVLLAVSLDGSDQPAKPNTALKDTATHIDPTTTASTPPNAHAASTIDHRLTVALVLAGFIVVAGVGQLMNRGTRHRPPAPWRSEA
ncbi:hypothetical protein J2Y48_003048 [Mycoplana sp. BE70]|uniref:hypothetical protein n=1 Tax=Mycoplana sp. BE70 TaxID=2817775 RepID=UPI002866BEE6|nr:hypothetical protein [Mycoplana sp. BE70]MDR6757751.1 hypothetical protein [Mycoplana sp. BE70]